MTTPLRVDGIDISRYQSGNLDMKAAKKAGLKWLYHKVTEGNKSVWQSQYDKRREEAKAAGIPFGAYHFARAQKPTKADAISEARHFLKCAKPVEGDLHPVLDLETTEGLSIAQLREWAAAFIGELSEQGFKCIIYTNFDLGNVGAHLLWTARYSNTNTQPKLKGWDIWQFSNGVYGVPKSFVGFGNVDLNTMRAGLKVDSMIHKGTAPKPEPEPKPTKTIAQVAQEVIDGKWGNGDVRIKKLTKAGYDPKKVQAKVNELLKPKPKKSLTLKVSTANIQNFNPNLPPKLVEEDMSKIKPISNLVLWQELAEKRDFDSLIKVMGNTDWGNTAHGNECMISWLRAIGTIVTSENVPLSGKAPGNFSPARKAKRLVLSTVLGEIEVINVHLTNGAYVGDKRDDRKPNWNLAWANTKKIADAALAAGRIVILGGDWNRKLGDIPKFHKNQKWIVGGNNGTTGIDGVLVILPPGVSMEVKGTSDKVTKLHSDHDGRTRTVVLSK